MMRDPAEVRDPYDEVEPGQEVPSHVIMWAVRKELAAKKLEVAGDVEGAMRLREEVVDELDRYGGEEE